MTGKQGQSTANSWVALFDFIKSLDPPAFVINVAAVFQPLYLNEDKRIALVFGNNDMIYLFSNAVSWSEMQKVFAFVGWHEIKIELAREFAQQIKNSLVEQAANLLAEGGRIVLGHQSSEVSVSRKSSMSGTFKAIASRSIVANVGDFRPRSIRLTKLTETFALSAKFS